jgi:hypothetical protein
MKPSRIALGILGALILAGAAVFAFARRVDDATFKARGWRSDGLDAALAAAKAGARPLFVKLGAPG